MSDTRIFHPFADGVRYESAIARFSYRSIVRDHQRRYPHQVRLKNTGDWRSAHTGRAHYAVTRGHLVWWHDGTDESIFGLGRGGRRLPALGRYPRHRLDARAARAAAAPIGR